MDALQPAAVEAETFQESGLTNSLAAAAAAAQRGVEATRQMIAATGRAKTLGERCLGHADPGALSVSYILRFMHEYVATPSDA